MNCLEQRRRHCFIVTEFHGLTIQENLYWLMAYRLKSNPGCHWLVRLVKEVISIFTSFFIKLFRNELIKSSLSQVYEPKIIRNT